MSVPDDLCLQFPGVHDSVTLVVYSHCFEWVYEGIRLLRFVGVDVKTFCPMIAVYIHEGYLREGGVFPVFVFLPVLFSS